MSAREAKLVKLLLVLIALVLVTGVIVSTVSSQRAIQANGCDFRPEDC